VGSAVSFQGLSKARAQVAQLAAALRDAPGVLNRAAVKVQAQVDAVARSRVGKHVATGVAQGSLTVAADGSLVKLSAARYLDYHAWWPFRRGMPPFVLKRAAQILAAEFLATIGDRSGAAGALAGEIVDAQAASDAKRAAKKVTRRLRA